MRSVCKLSCGQSWRAGSWGRDRNTGTSQPHPQGPPGTSAYLQPPSLVRRRRGKSTQHIRCSGNTMFHFVKCALDWNMHRLSDVLLREKKKKKKIPVRIWHVIHCQMNPDSNIVKPKQVQFGTSGPVVEGLIKQNNGLVFLFLFDYMYRRCCLRPALSPWRSHIPPRDPPSSPAT